MTISPEEVRAIARLTRLELTESEVARFQVELSKILEYVQQLESVDVEDVPLGERMRNAPREDLERPWPDTDALHEQAPQFEDGFFRVPRVVE